MKRLLLIFILSMSLNAIAGVEINNANVKVCFTPGGNCTQEIVDAIDHAKQNILVQAYSFTSTSIAKALVNAKERGVNVKVILDKSQFKSERYSSSKYLENQNIPVWIDYKPAIAHNKIIIIDAKTVVTGSFNFTQAAQRRNAENLLIIQSPALAKLYLQNWQNRFAVSSALSQFALLSSEKKSKDKRKRNLVFFDR